jgi:hypothetical protein
MAHVKGVCRAHLPARADDPITFALRSLLTSSFVIEHSV